VVISRDCVRGWEFCSNTDRAAAQISVEHDHAIPLDEQLAFEVVSNRTGQGRSFDVTSLPGEIGDSVPVGAVDHFLCDDRPGIKFRGDVVRGRANELHASFMGLSVRRCPGECRKKRMMDVDDPVRPFVDDFG
jgi:hypothetical protein